MPNARPEPQPAPTITPAFPSQAQVVVIGGGIVGCSVAYHLTKRGWRDVVLLERKQLTSGTTWHAAGLVTQLRATYNMSMLAKYSAELFPELERLTGQGTGFRTTGSILLATTDEPLGQRSDARSRWPESAASRSTPSAAGRRATCGR